MPKGFIIYLSFKEKTSNCLGVHVKKKWLIFLFFSGIHLVFRNLSERKIDMDLIRGILFALWKTNSYLSGFKVVVVERKTKYTNDIDLF